MRGNFPQLGDEDGGLGEPPVRRDKGRPSRPEPPLQQVTQEELPAAIRAWEVYNIKPAMPLAAKVEHLMMYWRMDAAMISEVLEIHEAVIQKEVDKVHAGWLKLGQPLDIEERVIARGRVLVELTQLKARVEKALSSGTEDRQLLALHLQVIQTIAKFQGVDEKAIQGMQDEVLTDPVTSLIDGLDMETLAKLVQRLGEESTPDPAPQ